VIQGQQETPVEPAFSHFFPFSFDPFQLEAMSHIRDGRSVMVAAPTSSGKTLVAEYALWRAVTGGSRAIYTTPIKALSNQKRRDLEALFPGKVGLLTGDRSENPDAPIVVMTTEVLRNMLVEDTDALHWTSCVVFDEVHYLADQDRGTGMGGIDHHLSPPRAVGLSVGHHRKRRRDRQLDQRDTSGNCTGASR